MSSREWSVLAVVLALFAGTAVFLVRVGKDQHLGQPGVKVVAEPTLTAEGEVVRTNSIYLPANIPDFKSKPVPISELEAGTLPQDTLFGRREYVAEDGFWTLISTVLMGTDRTSIHKPQYCLIGQGWRIDQTEATTIRIPRPHPYDLRVMKLTTSKVAQGRNGRPLQMRGLYVYWFVADGQLTPHHGERMWWMARDLIRTGVLQRWAYVTYFTVCLPGQEDAAYRRLTEFIAASVPDFQLVAGPERESERASGWLRPVACVLTGKWDGVESVATSFRPWWSRPDAARRVRGETQVLKWPGAVVYAPRLCLMAQ